MADIKFPKKQEQRLIPKYLLEYATDLQENHPDPSAEWGGSGVADIAAGTGIEITGETTKTISVDTETIPTIAELSTVAFSGSYSSLSDKPDLSVYELKSEAFTGDYNDLTNKPDLTIYAETSDLGDCAYLDENELSIAYSQITGTPTIPTKTSDLTNDSNFIPSDAANTKTYINSYSAPFGNTWSKAYYESNCIGFENQDGNSVLYFPTNKTDAIAVVSDIPTNVSSLNNDAGYITGVTWTDVTGKPTFATVATTGDYDDLTNKPTIPTVGNGTITIKKNNTTVDTFTTNQSSNKSINITVPTDTSDLTNGAGFITAAQVPAGWEVVDIERTTTTVSAADLAKLAGDNVCVRWFLDKTLYPNGYEILYKRGSAELLGAYYFDYNQEWYDLTSGYVGNFYVEINPTTGAVNSGSTNGFYAGHKIESGSGLVEGNATSYGKPLSIDTSVVALKSELFSGNYNDLTNKPTIPDAVSGTNDGTNWTTLTIGSDTYAIGGGSTPSNMVTTDTTQDITGEKTFIGEKRIKFKQSRSADKLGFTLYNNSNREKCYFEYNPTNDGLYLGRYGSSSVTEMGFLSEKNGSNYKVLIPNITTTGSADNNVNYMAVSVNNTKADSSGNVTLAIPTATSDLTNDSGFITGIDSTMVTTALGYTPGTSNFSGSYTDLTDKPTIPTVNDNTITITQGGVTKGSFTLNQSSNQTINVDDVPGMIGEVLYDVPNGEAGVNPITMAHSFADYSYVDIQYRNYDNAYEVKSVRVYDPNGKHVYLDWDVLVNGSVYAKKSTYILNGTTMTVRDGSDMQAYYSNGSSMGTQATATTDYQHQIKITKVVGYKQNNSPLVIPTTATSVSTVTPSTTQLVFTYTDNTTETITLMTGATVSTTTTIS